MPRQKNRAERYELYRQQLRELQQRLPFLPSPPPIDPCISKTSEFEAVVKISPPSDANGGGYSEQTDERAELGTINGDGQDHRLVIAVDYGTTYTGVAWCNGDISRYSLETARSTLDVMPVLSWPPNDCLEKIPSPIDTKFEGNNETILESGRWGELKDTRGVPRDASGLAAISSYINADFTSRYRDRIKHLVMHFTKPKRDRGCFRASSVERGQSGNFMCPCEKHRDKYDEVYRTPFHDLAGLDTIFTSILGGASALAMLTLDCRLQGQLDYTSQHWITRIYPQSLTAWLEELRPQTAATMLLCSIGVYSASAGYLYYKQRRRPHTDPLLICCVCLGALVGFVQSGFNVEDVVFKVFPGIILLVLIAAHVSSQPRRSPQGAIML